jgi:hypothetical protein
MRVHRNWGRGHTVKIYIKSKGSRIYFKFQHILFSDSMEPVKWLESLFSVISKLKSFIMKLHKVYWTAIFGAMDSSHSTPLT